MLASQAKRTIVQNSTLLSDQKWVFKTGFGCNSPDRNWKTDGNVTCPKRAQPGVAANARKNLDSFRERRCLRARDHDAFQNNDSSSVVTSNTRQTHPAPVNTEYLRMSKSQKTAFVWDLLLNPAACKAL